MSWLHAVIVLAICPFVMGCVVTGTMWKEANATRMSNPLAVGTLCDEGSPQCRGIVVRYELETNWRMESHPFVYVLVPLGTDSKPVRPFGYNGEARTIEQIAKGLSDAHRDAMMRAKLTLAGAPGAAPQRLRGFGALDRNHPDGPSSLGGGSLPPISVLVLQRKPDHSFRSAQMRVDSPVPAGALVLLLPSEIKRPSGDSDSARRRATLLTPFTLLADLVVGPVVFVAYALNGGG